MTLILRHSHFLTSLALLMSAAMSVAPAVAALTINEFMADNADGIQDEDGTYSDWIEIYNPDATPVNLLGWRLTDTASLPNKWVFPGVSLPAGGRLLIFASEKNRRDPLHELHTNFKLSKNGEYLGLLRPDGAVEHHYSPTYAPQYEDVSYGDGIVTIEEVAVPGYKEGEALEPGAACTWHVPTADSNDIFIGGQPNPITSNIWIGSEFDDSAWTTGLTGVGYDRSITPVNFLLHINSNCELDMFSIKQSVYIRVPFTVTSTERMTGLKLKMKYDDGFAAWINGSPAVVAGANVPATLTWNSNATAVHDDTASTGYVDFLLPSAASDSVIIGKNLLCIQGLNNGLSSPDALFTPQLMILRSSGLPVPGYFARPTPRLVNGASDPNPGPLVKNVPTTLPAPVATLPAESPGAVANSATEFSGNQGQNGWSYGYWTGGGLYDATTSFTEFVGGTTAGAWDGVTQFWTGTLWDRNTAGEPLTTISATAMFPNDSTPGPIESPVVRWTSDVSGPHMMTGFFNRTSTSGDGSTGHIFHNGTEIFAVVTHGSLQNFAINVTLQIGDRLDFTVDAGPAGTSDASDNTLYDIKINPGSLETISLPVTAEVLRTVLPVTSVELKWRVMYGSEQTLPMLDDGLHGDGPAGDGIYGASITTAGIQAGQMIRWRVVATDSGAEIGKSPPFDIADDSPEYFGTVAADSRTGTSQLPVLQMFIRVPNAADNVTGTRTSVFFLGEFYDNAGISVHGQSTAGFAKKSYNLDFNRDFRFRYKLDARRVKDIDLLTNWGDKSKVRNALAWEAISATGSKGHFAFPVRIERNGQFFAVNDMVEDGDDRYLERVGLDPAGALYKMYNTLDSSTTNVEKKTRRSENNSDLQSLITGLNPSTSLATRRLYSYDNVDFPMLLNNLATLALINSQDQGHKNYYLYKDPGVQNDWKLLAWDNDLSFGHTWTGGQNYFDDDIDSQRNMRNGAENRLKTLLYSSPELNKAWMRRMRTLMDQYLVSATSTTGYFETRIPEILDLIDPPSLPPNTSDAFLDFKRWGYWIDGNGGSSIVYTNPASVNHTARASAQRILTANPAPTYPQAASYGEFGRSSVPPFLPGRRAFLYNHATRPANSPNNTSGAEPIPAAQIAAPPISIVTVDYDPGAADEEYLVVRNSGTDAVDISDWTLSGGVDYTFPGGCVIPAGGGVTQHIGDLFVVRSPRSFRARTVSPKAGEYCFVSGPYSGRLSARGETVELRDSTSALIATKTWEPTPTTAQTALRISEIHFNPLNPAPAEVASNPSWTASDFEFVEFQNVSDTSLDLSGARIEDAVTFTFPIGATVAPGARILVVANLAAFGIRYSEVGLPIAGEWLGNLDNNGEKIKVVDSRGEEILEFSFGDWYSPTDGDGRSLVFLDPTGTSYADWGLRQKWSISGPVGGTPGAADLTYSMGYDVWENTTFPTLVGTDNKRSEDPDKDGLLNLVEYAIDSNPRDGTQTGLPQAALTTIGGQSYRTITFRRWKNSVDVAYIPEISSDLSIWNPLPIQSGSATDNGNGTETVTYRSTTPRSVNGTAEFVRLRVTEL